METAEKKTKRSVLKKARIKAIKDAAKVGPGIAYLNDVPTSPRKMRLVVDLIRGVDAFKALSILKFEAKHPASKLEKLLLSAMANWKSNHPDVDLDKAGLYVKEIFVDGGRILKRLRPAPQGRAHRVRKRSNHVTIVVDRMPASSADRPVEATEKKTKNAETSAAE
ncbi:MAG: 50S ribosomal protein L22 [Bacteroidota bacterium]